MAVLPAAFNVRAPAASEPAATRDVVAQQTTALHAQRSDPALCGDHTISVPEARHKVEPSFHLARLSV